MNAQNLLSFRKQIYDKIIMYIDNEVEDEDNELYSDLISIFQSSNIPENEHEFKELFILISHIEMYHHSNQLFLGKIEKILQLLLKEMKQKLPSFEICKIFQKNRRILLFLFQNELISIDDSIIKLIYDANPTTQYLFYSTELKNSMDKESGRLIDEEMKKQGEHFYNHFEENRQIGQNESYLCKLIREDSVEDFIEYTSRANINLSKKINDSIFETNLYLIENKPTIIEYAAFFGAIQIFQFLRLNEVELKSQLWNYAIHGRNPEIIHLLEEHKISPEIGYVKCYEEAIKCHHNEIAAYIIDNYGVRKETDYLPLKYWNYEFFPDIEYNNIFISCLCQYGYYVFVDIALKTECPDFNTSHLYKAIESENLDIFDILLSNPRIEISDHCLMKSQKLEKITIPSFIKSIGSLSFSECLNLSEVTIPSSVKTIGDKAFNLCQSLKHLTIPPSVTSIGKYAFNGCSSLTEIELPPNLTIISEGLFYECSKLNKITIPQSVTSIEKYAFNGCSSLTEIELPPNLTIISEGLFYECSKLNKITIPQSVTSIEKYAFNGCSSLTEIELPPNLTIISEGLFYECSKLNKITIPQSVTSIEKYAFHDCSSLTEIELPPDLTIISEGLFYHCSKLNKITIPSKVTTISRYAFGFCFNLNDLKIPESVTFIDKGAIPFFCIKQKKSCNIC